MKRILSLSILNFILIIWGLSAFGQQFLIDTSRVFLSEPRRQDNPGIAFDGTNYLVVWSDQRIIGTANIFGTFVNQNGTPLNPGGIVISSAPIGQGDPSVTFGGGNYFVVWTDSRNGQDDIYGARVTPSGQVFDPDGIPIGTTSGDKWSADVAFGGGVYWVVWVDERGDQDIYGARVDQSGALLDSTGVAISTAPSYQEPPHIAFGTSDFLVAWEDYRDPSGYADYYGARLSPNGTVLDPNGIAITSTATIDELYGNVAFDGTNWLAIWTNLAVSTAEIFGARIDPSGTVLDPTGFMISPAGTGTSLSSLTFDGSNYLVAWQDKSSFVDDIYGARVTPSGTVLDPTGIAISTANEDQRLPKVAAGGGNFMVTWQDERDDGVRPDIYGARVTPAGVLLDPNGIEMSLTSNKQTKPSAAFDGSNYLVAWEDNRQISDTTKIYMMRATAGGVPLDVIPFAISNTPGNQTYPTVVFDGLNYLVVWLDARFGYSNSDIYGARITPDGTILDPNGFSIAGSSDQEYYPSAAFDGTNTLAVWSKRVGSIYHIYGARVNSQGTVLDPNGIPIATAGTNHFNAVAAFADSVYLVVYEKQTGSSSYEDIYCTRVKPDGTVLDPGGFSITNITSSRQKDPSVSYDGQNFVVVWKDERTDRYNPDIYAARVTQDGAVLNPNGFIISTAPGTQEAPAVILEDTTSLIVWGDYRDGNSNLWAVRLSRSATIVDTFLFAHGEGDQTRPAMTLGSSQIFTVYEGFTGEVNGKIYNTTRAWGKLMDVYTGIKGLKPSVISHFQLYQNYPNPFNPSTTIRWQSAVGSWQTLKIYDILGREVETLVDKRKPAGEYQVQWDASGFPSGVYFYQLKADDFTAVRKMLLVK